MSGSPARLGDRPVTALLLDYGHTLITYQRPDQALRTVYDRVATRLEQAGAGPVPSGEVLLREVHDRIDSAVAGHERAGHLDEIDLIAAERSAYAACGLRLSDGLLEEVTSLVQEAWWAGIAVSRSVVGVLSELRRRGLRIGLCSNAPYRARDLNLQLEHFGLTRLLDSVTFSSEVGWRKPAPEMFRAALARLDAAAETTVMVGDRRREDVAGARALGMGSVRVRGHHDDAGPDDADAVIAELGELIPLLFANREYRQSGSVNVIADLGSQATTYRKGV